MQSDLLVTKSTSPRQWYPWRPEMTIKKKTHRHRGEGYDRGNTYCEVDLNSGQKDDQ